MLPTLTFGALYCFFVIGHDRRKILHYNVTRQPNALWIVLQLREAWGYDKPHRYLIFDRDTKFSADVVSFVKQHGAEPVRMAFRSPWQNGVAERWVGSVRRELLDHVIVLNQRHLSCDAGARPASSAEDGSQKPFCDPNRTQSIGSGTIDAAASAAPEA